MALPNQENLDSQHKPWYKSAWFIALGVLIIVWFGTPLLLRLVDQGDGQNNFTPAPVPGLEVTDVPLSSLETTDDPWLGSPIAPVVIVEFGDFECPFCKESYPTIKKVLELYPEAVKLIYRDFPVSAIHPQAVPAAEAANCAFRAGGSSAFWKFHDSLFNQQDNLSPELYVALAASLNLNQNDFDKCLSQHLTLAEIQADLNDGLAAGIVGTPTWFINGNKVEGAITLELWQKLIDYILVNQFKAGT